MRGDHRAVKGSRDRGRVSVRDGAERPAPRVTSVDPSQQRLVTKVARLYHVRGLRQAEIAARLQLSQSRVSRLLSQAEESGVVRTVRDR